MEETGTEALLKAFEEVSIIKEPKITLVRQKTTGQLFVRKTIMNAEPAIFQKLMERPHPNIAAIYGFVPDAQGITTIEEYIAGETLAQVQSRVYTLGELEVQHIVAQLIEALDHIHTMNPPIIHRDIKPSNVMLLGDGTVKLIDFDASRTIKKEKNQDTQLLGTAGYASPEQFGFLQTDARSDIYSLGVLINVLLTGKTPQERLCNGSFQKIVQGCTAIDPGDRYQNVRQLRSAVDKAISFAPRPAPFKAQPSAFAPSAPAAIGAARFLPPGFRTKKPGKMALASIGYILLAIFSFTLRFVSQPGEAPISSTETVVMRITFFCVWLALIFYHGDYLGCKRFFPFAKHPNQVARVIAGAVYSVLLPFTILVIGVILYSIFQ